jgi:hypothetical protein
MELPRGEGNCNSAIVDSSRLEWGSHSAFASCTPLRKSQDCSVPQFPPLYKGHHDSTYLYIFVKIDRLINTKVLECHLAHLKCAMTIS